MAKLIKKITWTAAAGFSIAAVSSAIAGLTCAFMRIEGVTDFAAAGTLSAVLAGGLFAAGKFSLFREGEPHLTVTQEVHAHLTLENYRHITVTTTLHNSSKVVVQPPTASCKLFQTAPVPDKDVEYIHAKATANPNSSNYHQYEWWQLYQVNKTWKNQELSIEPNQKAQQTFQFLIRKEVTAVLIHTAILNPQVANNGWDCYTSLEF